jgi:hypothetical protein
VQREAGFTIQVRTLSQMAAATIEAVTGTCDLTPTTSPASSNRKQARICWRLAVLPPQSALHSCTCGTEPSWRESEPLEMLLPF